MIVGDGQRHISKQLLTWAYVTIVSLRSALWVGYFQGMPYIASSSPVSRVEMRLAAAPLLTSTQVADLLQVSTATLCRWRQRQCGPKWINLGGTTPRYRSEDVEAFIAERRSA
jgi:predicted DNA-binding transcriptional regulator AlpA